MDPNSDASSESDDEHADEHRARVVRTASRALAAMQAGELEGSLDRLANALKEVNDANDASAELADAAADDEDHGEEAGTNGDAGSDNAKDLMLLLFHECSAMVAELGSGGTAPVKMQVYDDEGHEVSIDDADPPVRTAVRTLLAEVHGDSSAAAEQIEIALSNAAPEEMISVLVQALRWTIKLSAECVSRDLPVPDWITEALD